MSCGHTLCEECIHKIEEVNDNHLQCPLCMREPRSTVPNFALRDLLSVSVCSFHDIPLTWYCATCDRVECAECVLRKHRSCPALYDREQAIRVLKEQQDRVLSLRTHPYVSAQQKRWKELRRQKNSFVRTIRSTCEEAVRLVEKSFIDRPYARWKKALDSCCIDTTHPYLPVEDVAAALRRTAVLGHGTYRKLPHLTSFEKERVAVSVRRLLKVRLRPVLGNLGEGLVVRKSRSSGVCEPGGVLPLFTWVDRPLGPPALDVDAAVTFVITFRDPPAPNHSEVVRKGFIYSPSGGEPLAEIHVWSREPGTLVVEVIPVRSGGSRYLTW